MNIFDVDGELGEKLYQVYEFLSRALEAMQTIDEADWSDHMDSLHRKLKQVEHYWEFVTLKGEEE